MKKERWRWTLVLTPVSVLLLYLARASSFFAEEVFARRIYRVCSVVLNRISGLVPFSVAELLLLGTLVLGVYFIGRLFVRLIRGKQKGESQSRLVILGRFALRLACFLSVVLFLFVFFCGINYERYPFSYYSGLSLEKSTKQELYELCVSLAGRAKKAREEAIENDWTNRQLGKKAAEAMAALGREYPVLAGAYTGPKPVFFSRLLSMGETTGIFIPFTMEANVNVDCTDFTIPATMCHELSHLRGFMREDEANYIAYLACQYSEEPYVRYSGLMLALVYSANRLYQEDQDLYWSMRECYSGGMIEDFRRDAVYWSQFEHTAISTAANALNDTYLKANHQNDGTKSYGRMVDLLLAEYRKEKEKENGTN